MLTGQFSSHALQVVQAQISSLVMRSKTLFGATRMLPGSLARAISLSTPIGGVTWGVPERAITSPVLSTISRGSSDLPVALAGHTAVHRPHMVHESVSMSCFQVKSSMTEAPKLSISVSIRLAMGFMAPFGRSRSLRYMFAGEVTMWRNIVVGKMIRNRANEITCAIHHAWCQPLRLSMPSTSWASG